MIQCWTRVVLTLARRIDRLHAKVLWDKLHQHMGLLSELGI
jgi:hypothetical protein